LTGGSAERQMDVDEVVRQTLQRPKIRQLFFGASAKKQHQFAAFELARAAQAAPPFGHGTHGRTPRTRAYHDNVGARVVGHEETRAERPDDFHLVAHLEVAHVIAGHTTHRTALMVFEDALDGQ